MIVNLRKCKARDPATSLRCNTAFKPISAWQLACSPICAIHISAALRFKNEQKELSRVARERKDGLDKLKTRRDWFKEAQTAINAYCRTRDLKAGHGCIDCGKPFEPQKVGGSVDAGHFLSRGSHPNLALNELNIHAQRKNCNRPGGTTAAAFRLGMIKRIGLDAVEALEADHEPKHYTIDELVEIKTKYLRLTRELKKD